MPAQFYETSELTGIKLHSAKGFRATVLAYTERHGRNGYFSSAGNRTAFIPKTHYDDLIKDLKQAGRFQFIQIPAASTGDLSPEEAARVRMHGRTHRDPKRRQNLLRSLERRRQARQDHALT